MADASIVAEPSFVWKIVWGLVTALTGVVSWVVKGQHSDIKDLQERKHDVAAAAELKHDLTARFDGIEVRMAAHNEQMNDKLDRLLFSMIDKK